MNFEVELTGKMGMLLVSLQKAPNLCVFLRRKNELYYHLVVLISISLLALACISRSYDTGPSCLPK
jgi:hypothetical protein